MNLPGGMSGWVQVWGIAFQAKGMVCVNSWRCERINNFLHFPNYKKLYSNSVLLEYVEWRDDGK